MAAGGETELRRMLLGYMSNGKGGTELKKVLSTSSVAIRYDHLISVRGGDAWTGVFRAAREGDVEMVRCMLAEFTPEQAYNVLKLQTSYDNTPLLVAAYSKHVEVVEFLLSCVNQQQRFNLLIMKGNCGPTVLHAALANNGLYAALVYNNRDTAKLIFSTLSLQQQLQLINFKDKDNKSVADLYPEFIAVELVAKDLTELKSTIDDQVAVIDDQKREIASWKEQIVKLTAKQKREADGLKEGLAKLKSTVDDQAAVIADQKREIAGQKKLIVKQKREMADQKQEAVELKQEIQRGKDKQTELEKKLSALEEKFDIFIRTPIVLGGEDDQEHAS